MLKVDQIKTLLDCDECNKLLVDPIALVTLFVRVTLRNIWKINQRIKIASTVEYVSKCTRFQSMNL
jgi:hypothetical protein